jgi:2'-5' RNA ligase
LRGRLPHARIRWTRPEQFHLTLRFLGNVVAQGVPSLTEAVAAACKPFAPLRLRAARLGVFPNARRPRVIWVGLEDSSGQLVTLQRAIQAATQEFSVEAPEANFAGHVTLGRVKEIRRKETEALASAVADSAEKSWGEWTAERVEIFRSDLSTEGAVHVRVANADLTSNPR